MNEEVLLFELGQVGGESIGTFALSVADVYQVIEPTRLSTVPMSPDVVEGIMSFSGRVVTVVDPSLVLGYDAQSGPVRQVVIVRDGVRAFGNLGLKVSRIRQIVKTSGTAEVDAAKGEHVRSVIKLGKRLVHVIDVPAFMDGLGKEFGTDGRMASAPGDPSEPSREGVSE
ncbi:MAG: chemotaxis protein CheW [Myxococcota bacterium]